MSIKKDVLFKKIDFISEDIRFWHNLTIALLSGLSGIAYLYAQNRLTPNWLTILLVLAGTAALFAIVLIVRYNYNKREKLLNLIKKLKEN